MQEHRQQQEHIIFFYCCVTCDEVFSPFFVLVMFEGSVEILNKHDLHRVTARWL